MTRDNVTIMIRYRAQPGQAERARRELQAIIARVVESEPDCRGIRMFQDPEDETGFLLDELWTSRAAYFGPHLETEHLRAFRERAPEFMAGPPEITTWMAVGEAGPRGREVP